MKKNTIFYIIIITALLLLIFGAYYCNHQNKQTQQLVTMHQDEITKLNNNNTELNKKILNKSSVIASYEKLFSKPDNGHHYNLAILTVLTKEGLACEVHSNVNYILSDEKIAELYNNYGFSYEEKALLPLTRSIIRNEIKEHSLKDILVNKKEDVRQNLENNIKNTLLENGIEIKEFKITDFVIPSNLKELFDETGVQYQWNE